MKENIKTSLYNVIKHQIKRVFRHQRILQGYFVFAENLSSHQLHNPIHPDFSQILSALLRVFGRYYLLIVLK